MRRLRNELGLSTKDVERISRKGGKKGISAGYISMIESGEIRNPSPEKLRILADVYNITDIEIVSKALGFSPNPDVVLNEKLARIQFGYAGMPEEKKRKLEPLIDLLEREYMRLKDEE